MELADQGQTAEELVYYEDRSGAETDDTCGMRYWYQRLEGERGIVPINEPFDLKIGRETHEDLAAVAELTQEELAPQAIEELLNDITGPLTDPDRFLTSRMEVLYRRLGWTAAFALFVEPRIRERFTTIQIEKEIILDRSPLWVGVTPDRVLEERSDHYLVYREYKTTISASQKWIQSWPFAVQMHLGIAAASEELNKSIAFGQVMGLMKGDYRSGKLSHPYVWGWRNGRTGQWTHDYNKARSSEWAPTPVWEYEGGVVKWVQECGEEVALQQFPHSAPVFLNKSMLDNWIKRRLNRQAVIAEVRTSCETDTELRQLYFEQRTRSCRPGFGDACPYLACCWNAGVQSAPLASGLFVPREPHHEIELQVERNNHGAN